MTATTLPTNTADVSPDVARILDALELVPVLTGSASAPDVATAGAAWPVWAQTLYTGGKLSNRAVSTFDVIVIMPSGYGPATTAAALELRDTIAAALGTAGPVERAEPVLISFGDGNDMPAIRYRLTPGSVERNTMTDTYTDDAPAPRADSPEPEVFEYGPGTLSIGATGSEIDVSCLVNSAKVTPSKDQADSTTKLCGIVRQGKVTYTYALSGNVDVDIADPAGFFALGWEAPGTTQPFTFTPSTEAGTSMAGELIIDPLEFGGDDMGATMVSDFEFTLIGKPVLTFPAAP